MTDYRDNVEVEDMDDKRLEEHSIQVSNLSIELLYVMSRIHLTLDCVRGLSHSFYSDGFRWGMEGALVGCAQSAYYLTRLIDEVNYEKNKRKTNPKKEAAK